MASNTKNCFSDIFKITKVFFLNTKFGSVINEMQTLYACKIVKLSDLACNYHVEGYVMLKVTLNKYCSFKIKYY